MGHILYGAAKPRIATSDDDWYPAVAQVGKRANAHAHRTDITSVISTEAGMGAPACFIPSLAELHLNTEILDLGRADKVNVEDALWRLEHAAAVGAMDHEAAHARHTKFDPRDLMENYGATRKMIDVITTLEEPRIERNALRAFPDSLPFLRATAMEIVGRDFVIGDSAYGASVAAGLLLARADAGVLRRVEVRTFRKDIEGVLGKDVLAVLEPLWQRFLRLTDSDFAGMVQVATEWLEALDEDPEDTEDLAGESLIGEPLPGEGDGEGEGSGSGSGDGDKDGEGGSGEGEGSGDGKAEGFGDKVKGKARRAEVRMDGEIVVARADERADRRRKERDADRERRAEGEDAHEEAWGGLHGKTTGGSAGLIGEREPTAEERRAARMLASALEKVEYRDRAVRKVTSMVPPGRLRGGAAVQDAALRSKGQDSDLPLWQGKRRTKVESTPLTIGLACDVSGSMGGAMAPLASSQWVLSTAGAHIDAKVATVHFGESVRGIMRAGAREKNVRVYRANDGFEAFKGAALALDRELNLLDGPGARLLFVSSDGVFVDGTHYAYAETFMRLAARKGVAVMFLNFTGGCISFGAPVIDCTDKSPVEVAQAIGKAAVAEMKRLDRRV